MLSRRVRINLHGGNDQVLYSGAQVSGFVDYKSSGVERLTSLNIDFRGVARVAPRKGSKLDREYIELFHITENLLREPMFTEARKSHTWDFVFSMPIFTGPDRSNLLYLDSGNPLFDEKPHHLPPSIDSAQSEEVNIEYQIYTVANRAFGTKIVGDQLHDEPVVHNLDNIRYRPDVEFFHPEAPRRLEQHFCIYPVKSRRFSLGSSSLGDASQSPLSSFIVISGIPTTIALGQSVPITFQIRENSVEARKPFVASSPYGLKRISLSAIAHTYRRTARNPHSDALTETNSKLLGTEKGVANLSLDSTKTFEFPTTKIANFPSSFKSYSIARAYELQLDITIVYDKQEFDARFREPVEAIVLLTQEAEISRRESNAPPPALPDLPPRDETEVLPSYGDLHGES